MEFVLFSDLQKEKYREELYKLLEDGDKDFVPPLSKRSSTTQQNFNTGEDNGISAYFNMMIKQNIIGVFEENELLGFLSFIENWKSEHTENRYEDNIYLSTLILSEKTRGKGITYKLYDHVFNTLYPRKSIFTRTWSTNAAHIKILGKFEFETIKTIKNDRGDGIDTVYFAKKRIS